MTPPHAWREAVMTVLTVVLLLLLGMVIPHLGASEAVNEQLLALPMVRWALISLWALIVLESGIGVLQASGQRGLALRRWLLIGLIPPYRLALAPHIPQGWIWILGLGWRQRDSQLFTGLERGIVIPMLVVTLLVVPVVVSELFFQAQIAASPQFALVLHLVTGIIWTAFCAEFILLGTVAPKKLTYCQQNWINIVIIILPLLAFLRALTFFRILKLGELGKLLQTFRIRGLRSRAQQIAFSLNIVDRIKQRNPERYLESLRERERSKLQALEHLRQQIRTVETRIATRNSDQKAS